MLTGFLGTYFIGAILLALSFAMDLIFVQLIYKIHSKLRLVEFDYRKRLFRSLCISEIIGCVTMIIVFFIVGSEDYSFILHSSMPIYSVINSSLFLMPVIPVTGIIVSVLSSFILSYFYGLRNDYYDMTKMQTLIVSIIAAITCAPYIFLVSAADIIIKISMALSV